MEYVAIRLERAKQALAAVQEAHAQAKETGNEDLELALCSAEAAIERSIKDHARGWSVNLVWAKP